MKRRLNIAYIAIVSIVAIIAIIYIGINYRELDIYSLALSIVGAFAALLGYVMSSETYLKGYKDNEKEKGAVHTTEGEKQNKKETHAEVMSQNEDPNAIEDPTIMPQREIPQNGYAYDDIVSLRRRDVILHFRKTEKRLSNEIDRLNRRANINLVIGSIIALVGVLGLIAFILGEPEKESSSELTLIVVHWVTRLSLVSFVEVFAIFFLRMYKTELLSIQYYQDELTSIESRKIALMFSVIHDCQEDISKSIECLVNIDRNFKMDTTQTTVDLEKIKTENSIIKSQMQAMIEIFKDCLPFNSKKEV